MELSVLWGEVVKALGKYSFLLEMYESGAFCSSERTIELIELEFRGKMFLFKHETQ